MDYYCHFVATKDRESLRMEATSMAGIKLLRREMHYLGYNLSETIDKHGIVIYPAWEA